MHLVFLFLVSAIRDELLGKVSIISTSVRMCGGNFLSFAMNKEKYSRQGNGVAPPIGVDVTGSAELLES